MTRRPKFAGYLLAFFLSASLMSPGLPRRRDKGSRPAQHPAPAPPQRPAPAQRPDTGNRPPQRTAPPEQRPDRGNRPSQPAPPAPTSRQGSTSRGSSDAARRDQAPVSRDDRPPARSGSVNPSTRNSGRQTVDPNRPTINHQTVDPKPPPSTQYCGA